MFVVINKHKDANSGGLSTPNPLSSFSTYDDAEHYARKEAMKHPERHYFVMGLSATIKMPDMLPVVLMNTGN